MPDNGNLKVGSNLFLNGEFYAAKDGKWFGLKEYIQSFMPDIQFGSIQVPVTGKLTGEPSNDTVLVKTLTSTLPVVKTASVHAGLVGVVLKDRAGLVDWYKSVPVGPPFQLFVTGDIKPQGSSADKNKYDLSITWSAGPRNLPVAVAPAVPPPPVLAIESLTISYIVVFFP